jgi:hypothetical protein
LEGAKLTEIEATEAGCVMVTMKLVDFVVSVTDVAVSVTVLSEGMAEGAV